MAVDKNRKARKQLFSMESRRAGSFALIQPQHALSISSAALHTIAETKPPERRSPDLVWQTRAYELSDQVGELGYLLHLKANTVARCGLLPQQWVNGAWENATDERALRVASSFVGPNGGEQELKRRAALHLSTAGESYLLGTPLTDGMGSDPNAQEYGIVWEFLSTDEIRIAPGRPYERRRDGITPEDLPPEAYLARLWRASSRYSEWADSEVRRVRSIAEEVLTLTQMVDAIASSKLSANAFFIPEAMTIMTEDSSDEGDGPGDGLDDFTRAFMKHMTTPKRDPRSAASIVPLVFRGPGEQGKFLQIIELSRNLDTMGIELRKEALTRLAQGLDSPPELMSGKHAINHWGAWNIDGDFIVKHVSPLLDLIAQFLTIAYLRPMLMLFEGMSVDDANLVRYEGDLSPVTTREDEAASAQALHPLEVISDETLRRANHFDDSDKPDDAELFIRRALRLVTASPQVLGPVLLNLIPGFENVDVSKIAAGPAGAPGAPLTGPPLPIQGPPTQNALRELHIQLLAACDGALERALEKAGNKIITVAGKNLAVRDRLRSVPRMQVASMVTPEELSELGFGDHRRLLESAWDGLQNRAAPWIGAYLMSIGQDHFRASDAAALAASELCEAMNAYTDSNFHSGFSVTGTGFRTPDSLVLGALTPLLDLVA